VVVISLPASLEFSESPVISLERCLIFMTTNAQITTNKMPPTIPPAIAPMFGDEALGVGSAPNELEGSIVAASPTANVEKWVTANKHEHCPFCITAMHGDNGSGTAEGLFAVASETA
jgi:hypothetical protein